MLNKNEINAIQDKLFSLFINVSYILIIVSAFGLSQTAPKYLETMDYYVRIYVCLFLIWRFNPIRKAPTFTDLDRKIAFSAGTFILTTTVLNEYLMDTKLKILNFLHKN
jgi:hypothetical protein